MQTKVIALYAGSGAGKSTTAAGLFYKMKLADYNVELVREYIKQWAWEGIKPTPYDQPYIFGKQSKSEARLYGKVDYIVTDSPLYLAPIYELFYTGKSIVLPSVNAFIRKAKDNGIQYHNFFIKRAKPFDPRGRYETEEDAKKVDKLVEESLKQWGMPFSIISCKEEDRVDYILNEVLNVK